MLTVEELQRLELACVDAANAALGDPEEQAVLIDLWGRVGRRKIERQRLFGLPTGFECLDCGVDTDEIDEIYAVRDDVWGLTGIGACDGMLCIGCLEMRINRTLTADDFTDCPINRAALRGRGSERLVDRMTTQ